MFIKNPQSGKEHLALIHGDIKQKEGVYVRMHSECLTGDVLGSVRCDCRDQLEEAMSFIVEQGAGVILYLRQEGRGIGLFNKIKAYVLQDQGRDTVDANRDLGFDDDARDYSFASLMIKSLGIKSITLLTNNPQKVEGLKVKGIKIKKREALKTKERSENQTLLKNKEK